jgi:hypothetical protein
MRVEIFINIVCTIYIYIYIYILQTNEFTLVKYILLRTDNQTHVTTFIRVSKKILIKYKINCQSAHLVLWLLS